MAGIREEKYCGPEWGESINSLKKLVLPRLICTANVISIKCAWIKAGKIWEWIAWDASHVGGLWNWWWRVARYLLGTWVHLRPDHEDSWLPDQRLGPSYDSQYEALDDFNETPVRSELCLTNTSWPIWKIEGKDGIKGKGPARSLLKGMV